MATRLTPHQVRHRANLIETLLDAGHAKAEIVTAVGVDIVNVRRFLRTHAPDLWERWNAMPRNRRPRTPGPVLDDIHHFADMGYNVNGIAQRLGVKPESVKRRLQRRREWELLDRIRVAA